MADVIMNHVIDRALDLTPLSHRPKFFCIYVVNCFAFFPDPTYIDIFLNNLNNIRNQIQFIKEIESQNSLFKIQTKPSQHYVTTFVCHLLFILHHPF